MDRTPHPLSRRSLIAGAFFTGLGVTAAFAQDRPMRGNQTAERIIHPRVSQFDIGPADKAFRVFIGLPSVAPPPDGYSLILALDGNASFPTLWHQREARAPQAPVVLVGLGYPVDTRNDVTRRWFDLTSPGKQPVPPQTGLRGPGDRPTGGQTAFLRMIADELLPRLKAQLPLNAGDMTLFGHSLGGLFVLHALFTQPELFARYVAADPSLWWNAGEALREAAAFRGGVMAAGGRLHPARALLVAIAGAGDPAILAPLSTLSGLELIHRPYPKESHGSVITPALRDALDLHLGRLG